MARTALRLAGWALAAAVLCQVSVAQNNLVPFGGITNPLLMNSLLNNPIFAANGNGLQWGSFLNGNNHANGASGLVPFQQVAGLGGWGSLPGAFPGAVPAPFGLGGLSGNPAALNNFGAFGLGPFAQLSPANQKAADDKKKQEIQDLQDALKGDPSVAAVVGPALLLASAITLTVSPSLATASTSIGIVGALLGNLLAWTKWLNNAENFFLSLRTAGVAGKRHLLAAEEDPAAAQYRALLLNQMQVANKLLQQYGKGLNAVQANIKSGPFLGFLQSQVSSLKVAQNALKAVAAHPLGKSLNLGTLRDGTVLNTLGGVGGGQVGEALAAAIGKAMGTAATAVKP